MTQSLLSVAPRKIAVKLEKSEDKSDVEKKNDEMPLASTASEKKEHKGYEYIMNIVQKMKLQNYNNPIVRYTL